MPINHDITASPDDQGVVWYVRMNSGDVSRADREAFELWSAIPDNRAAYRAAEATWGAVAPLEDIYKRRKPTTRRSATALVALLVVGLAGAGTWAVVGPDAPRLLDRRHETQRGEMVRVELDGGTTAWLNGDSLIVEQASLFTRRVKLVRGEVRIAVGHDSDRPFELAAGGDLIRDVGTVFDVDMRPTGAIVSVSEGAVSVWRDGKPGVALSQGEAARLSRATITRLPAEDVSAQADWLSGRVTLIDTPLVDAVARVNRHNPNRLIVVGDPRLEGLRVSGSFAADDPQSFLDTLVAVFPLRVQADGEGRLVLFAATGAEISTNR